MRIPTRRPVVSEAASRLYRCQELKSFACRKVTPNPSIEGMPKRLRLSVTPHVKR